MHVREKPFYINDLRLDTDTSIRGLVIFLIKLGLHLRCQISYIK